MRLGLPAYQNLGPAETGERLKIRERDLQPVAVSGDKPLRRDCDEIRLTRLPDPGSSLRDERRCRQHQERERGREAERMGRMETQAHPPTPTLKID